MFSHVKPMADNDAPGTGVKLDGKSIWKIHMDFFFENPFFLNLF